MNAPPPRGWDRLPSCLRSRPANFRFAPLIAATRRVQEIMLREPPLDNGANDTGGDAPHSVTDVLRAALAPLAAGIDAAFIYGPLAHGAVAGHGHIDVMIIGNEIAYADVIPRFIAAAKYLGRTINPSVYTAADWRRKLAGGNRVIIAVLKQRRIFLVGSEDGIPRPR